MTGGLLQQVTSLSSFALSIDPKKIHAYLLDLTHVKGGPKAAFFLAFGFDRSAPIHLMDALVDQARAAVNVSSRPHPRGYGIEISAVGVLNGLDGRSPTILTAWNWIPDTTVSTGRTVLPLATFVTARPAE
ncbi:DUF6883 domain-containing protein [uncultured Enterovirga sp.]|uniref:DUF6883 domain-containing protein n=1 Tax=uncultured Enterovirga sp. TaxID=2026352 RepID=UPI0035CA0F3E